MLLACLLFSTFHAFSLCAFAGQLLPSSSPFPKIRVFLNAWFVFKFCCILSCPNLFYIALQRCSCVICRFFFIASVSNLSFLMKPILSITSGTVISVGGNDTCLWNSIWFYILTNGYCSLQNFEDSELANFGDIKYLYKSVANLLGQKLSLMGNQCSRTVLHRASVAHCKSFCRSLLRNALRHFPSAVGVFSHCCYAL